ncbi:MAG: bifunctional heptose 7-phosphate kinase/heptose 1-phosphate adenyltransferase, partial [Candidatus Binatia bacterium]
TAICVRDTSRPTIRKIRHVVRSQQLLRVDYETTDDLSAEIEQKLLQEVDRVLGPGNVDGILVSDYAKGVITEGVARRLLAVAQKHDIPLAADIKPSRGSYFKGATFISPNRKEAHEILGFNEHERGGRTPEELARLLSDKMETDVYVTLAADGMYVLTRDGENEHVPQEHVVEVFDPSGAGDTAASMLMLARLAGASPLEAAELANAAGAVVVGKVGSAGLTPDELIAMMTHRHDTPSH